MIAPQVEAEALDGLFSSYLQAIYYPTYCRVDGLVCGVAVAALRVFHAEAWARYGNPRVTLPLGMALVTGAIALAAEPGTLGAARWQPVLSLAGAVAFYPLFSLGSALLLNALIDAEPRLRNLRIPGVTTVAILSYSLYLTHKPVMHLDRLLIDPAILRGWSGTLVYLSTSLLAASLLWLVVERPFLKLRERWFGRTISLATLPSAFEPRGDHLAVRN